MGQYYLPVLEKDGEIKIFSLQGKMFKKTRDFDYYNGLKLMEHSYYRSPAMVATGHEIYKNPMKVYWIGDYADDYIENHERYHESLPNYCLTLEKAMDIYEKTWKDDNKKEIDYAETFDVEFEKYKDFFEDKFLINHTKDEYIDLSKYKGFSYTCRVHPLSLLTAIGNGLGGGDYYGKNENLIGYWAGDIISLEDSDSFKNIKENNPLTDVTNELEFNED